MSEQGGDVAVVAVDALTRAVMEILPNRCCAGLGCPYDQYDATEFARSLLPTVAAIWEDGCTAGYQGAHAAFNRMGYIERGQTPLNPYDGSHETEPPLLTAPAPTAPGASA